MSKWQRFQYYPVRPLGEDGRMVTGCKQHIELSRRAAAEGMVLLKNTQDLLPLKHGSHVALFGKASVDYVKGGGGSGDVTVAYVANLCDGMEIKADEGKVSVFEPLHAFYRENVRQQRENGAVAGMTIEPTIPADLLKDAAAQCDTAIISICRFSGEGYDRKGEPNDGDFYLSLEEQKMVQDVTDHFDNIVVVLNVGGMVDTSWFCKNDKIRSVLLAWQGGMEGAFAEADILCGDVCPSGKLVDTFASCFDDYPSSANFNESEDYVCYTDDIFVGYRYFETIPGAAQKVNYPFGFGLSYTTFSSDCIQAQLENDTISVVVRVTNTGTVAGKEVLQLYSSAPKCRLEMPKLELRTFQKTGLLQLGEQQDIHMNVPVSQLAVYDEAQAAWVIPKGTYQILVGTDVRQNRSVLSFEIPEERTVFQVKNRCVPRKLPCRLKADGSFEALDVTQYDTEFDTSNFPARGFWEAEVPMPFIPENETPEGRIRLERVVSGEISLDAFLESLTNDELITLMHGCPNRGVADTCGVGGLEYLGIPPLMTADGPAGLRIHANRGVYTTAWPVATALACTWNADLVQQVGQAGAMEVEENNIAMWLTPAINIHRSPLCGRNFEYYSEDPVLTGVLAAAMVRGIQSRNVSACVKHFCVNNKETNRALSDSRVSERALREIYLKAFEIVVKQSGVLSVMTSYNKLNGTYTSENKDLITGILREEWGYDGLVITDWYNLAEPYREALAGNNIRMPHGDSKRMAKAMELGLITRQDIMSNVRKLLELLLKLD